MVVFDVETDGSVSGARVGYSMAPELNQAALDYIRDWTFEPQPVRVAKLDLIVVFQIVL